MELEAPGGNVYAPLSISIVINKRGRWEIVDKMVLYYESCISDVM